MASPPFTSPYTPNTEADRHAMLDAIGVASVEELFQDIPPQYRNPSFRIPPPRSELELRRYLEGLAGQNAVPGEYACFLGAGTYRHYIPAVVRQIVSRSEYMTSYTPYQPEVSQGTLQTEYEFQTLVLPAHGHGGRQRRHVRRLYVHGRGRSDGRPRYQVRPRGGP